MKTHFTLSKMASLVLLASIVAAGSSKHAAGPRSRSASQAVRTRTPRLPRAAHSWVSSGRPGRRRRHGRLRGDKPRRRACFRGACAGEPRAWRRQCLRRAAAADRVERSWVHQSCNRGAVGREVCVGTRLVSARSSDGGKSFGQAESVPGSDASGNRGWESAAVTPNGDVVAVWLDHREVPARTDGATAGPHQHGTPSQRSAADGVARAQLSQIFFARLNDPASARAIAPGVCYCCKTSVATGANGTVVAAWRHVYTGNARDIALAKSSDGGRTFASPVTRQRRQLGAGRLSRKRTRCRD